MGASFTVSELPPVLLRTSVVVRFCALDFALACAAANALALARTSLLMRLDTLSDCDCSCPTRPVAKALTEKMDNTTSSNFFILLLLKCGRRYPPTGW